MFKTQMRATRWLVVPLACMVMMATANAQPPEHAGKHGTAGKTPPGLTKHDGKQHHGMADSQAKPNAHINVYFNDARSILIRDYYHEEFSAGHCPPGLAKKHNGCMPPGQAKKWQLGHRLPDDVVFYDLPSDLLAHLPHDNPAYKLIRVGSDILRIQIGTGIVVDALGDLGGLFP